MISLETIREISVITPSKIILLVIDGLGGLPDAKTGKTELQTARTPNLDHLARNSICGLIDPVSPGITPGSGPGHLALFGYDPLRFVIGRGAMEAIGVGFELGPHDVAARGNFCSVDNEERIVDRRAGRISTEKCVELCRLLAKIRLEDVEIFVMPVREHRFTLVLRGNGLSSKLSDTDPQKLNVPPKVVEATSEEASNSAHKLSQFISAAKGILAGQIQANMILLRGFSKLPVIPSIKEIYKLNPVAIARYPMYKGLARLVGMQVVDTSGEIEKEFKILTSRYAEHDFFYLHFKETDSAGEDGDFNRKVKALELIDSALPELLDLKPDVIVITGDHSTPALLKGHSWHPVPIMLYSQWCRTDGIHEFSERACTMGGLGRIPAIDVMPLAMANALKLNKFGA